jgi:DNA topoisomerase-2
MMLNQDENARPMNVSPTKKAKGGKKGRTIEETYQKKSQLEHILLRPDTYGKFLCMCLS